MGLDQTELKIAPQLTRSEILKIANQLAITLGLPFLILATITIGIFVFKSASAEKTTIWWFVVAIAVLLISFVQGLHLNAESKRLYDEIKSELRISATKTKSEIKEIVEENIDPHFTVLRSLPGIRSEAASLIAEEIKNYRDKKDSLGVVYFGSASLSPTTQEFRDASHSENQALSDIVRYQNALDDLKVSETKVTRFIRLLDENAFLSRDAKTRNRYLIWLENQVARLKTTSNYFLLDSRRAPEWGGPRSSILTTHRLLDIIGDGDAGLLLISSRIPSVIIEISTKYFWAALRDENKPQSYSKDQAYKLEAKLKELKDLHEERVAQEKL